MDKSQVSNLVLEDSRNLPLICTTRPKPVASGGVINSPPPSKIFRPRDGSAGLNRFCKIVKDESLISRAFSRLLVFCCQNEPLSKQCLRCEKNALKKTNDYSSE